MLSSAGGAGYIECPPRLQARFHAAKQPDSMIRIDNLIYRIEGRLLLEGASATIPDGHKVGLVGRNGTGKTTLIRLIDGTIAPESGSVEVPRGARIGGVAQEAPDGDIAVIDCVLAADRERAELMERERHATDAHEISEIHLRLADIEAHAAPARAATILHGLGFPSEQHGLPVGSFSGGWRMRIALAAVLLSQPDVLLLDEPTNYLDLEGTLWLESYIRRYPYTVIMVSHDRDLLNTVAGSILHLDQGKLTLYTGGYDDFENTLREKLMLQMKMRKKQEAQRAHMQSFVDRFRYKAKKARMAQSRLKAIARLKPIPAVLENRVVPFIFPAPKKMLSPPLIHMQGVAVGYAPDKPVLRNLDLRLDPDDRIGLLGANGNGKSTFAKLISERLAPQAGTVTRAPKLQVGYFAQHQLDELDATRTAYDYARDLLPQAGEAERRARLGQFGFGIEKSNTRVDNLSGGEKARLLFALAAFHGPHIMILDEPTNHLDVDSREALVMALNDYVGAVILISHDRHLIETSADELWLCDGGTVSRFDGDLEDYKAMVLGTRRDSVPEKPEKVPEAETAAPSPQERRKQAAELREQLKPLKKSIQQCEAKMLKIRDKMAEIDARLADTGLYERFPDSAQALARDRGKLQRELAGLEEEWLQASEEYDTHAAALG
jgi:ATP-binding cassette subfamily F protein 3